MEYTFGGVANTLELTRPDNRYDFSRIVHFFLPPAADAFAGLP
jgi:hypothetical protein